MLFFTATSSTKGNSMSVTTDRLTSSTQVPSSRRLHAFIAVGMLITLVSFAVFAYMIYHDYLASTYGECTPASEFDPSWDETKCTGIRWYYWAPPSLLGALLWSYGRDRYKHYYIRVYSGKVVGLDCTPDRYASWYVQIEGKTLAGETRRYWVSISYNSWRKLKDGDDFSWRR